MNGLYGMPETAIEDADHATSDDLTSKLITLKEPRKVSLALSTTHPLLYLFILS